MKEVIPRTIAEFGEYLIDGCIAEARGECVILYKAVEKKNEKYLYFSGGNYFEYKIGEMKCENDPSPKTLFSYGLHVGCKDWESQKLKWENFVLLECEVPMKKIVIPDDFHGAVRSSEMRVLREVEKDISDNLFLGHDWVIDSAFINNSQRPIWSCRFLLCNNKIAIIGRYFIDV